MVPRIDGREKGAGSRRHPRGLAHQLGWNLLYLNWDRQGAERAAERALELNPDSAGRMDSVGSGSIQSGTRRRGHCRRKTSGRTGAVLQPGVILLERHVCRTSSSFDNAIEQLRRTLTIDPGDANTHGVLAGLYAVVGEREKALEQCEAALALARGSFHRFGDICRVCPIG